ncbi:MAG TPA: hypothetical protein PKZ36_01260 [Candidatus Paceibacterota bacterium]|nr:hypothetical protein [Candidatus Paceibacterota bacterium]HPT18018.1 hypothetical protein [Candidatus Paceibacterota bacterium]
MHLDDNYKKYLPSKKFAYSIASLLACGLIVFLIANLLSSKNSFFSSKKETKISLENMTTNELITLDSDGDSIPDWEEALWGTDPKNKKTFDNINDSEYIENKKIENGIKPSEDDGTLTETDKFAREFFATYMAMKTTGQIDDKAITEFSTALGQNIAENSVIDEYSKENIQITKSDTAEDQKSYYIKAGSLFEQYKEKGIGGELQITAAIANSRESSDIEKSENYLLEISNAYQEFAKKLVNVPVPESLTDYHLQIINNANNTGISIINMAKIISDPIVGVSGLSQYQKYSNSLVESVESLESFLSKNGIIPE